MSKKTFGTDSSEILNGSDKADELYGLGGDDRIFGLAGNDILDGGNNKDQLFGGDGNDQLYGGEDNDRLFGEDGNDELHGGNGDDNLNDDQGNNKLYGDSGNDRLLIDARDASSENVVRGNNLLDGGSGHDQLSLYNIIGSNTIMGGSGDDRIFVRPNNSTIGQSDKSHTVVDGGSGDEGSLYYGDVLDFRILDQDQYPPQGPISMKLNGNAMSGTISSFANDLTFTDIEHLNIEGTRYADILIGGNDTDNFWGLDGNDSISSGAGIDYIDHTFNGNAIINSGDGQDLIRIFCEVVYLEDGTEEPMPGQDGTQYVDGGADSDKLIIETNAAIGPLSISYSDALKTTGIITAGDAQVNFVNIETFEVQGSAYNDILIGGNGDDYLAGGGGEDVFEGGIGNDTLVGSGTFVLNGYDEGVDNIYFFEPDVDHIQIAAAHFGGGLTAGELANEQFSVGETATTSGHRFIYNDVSGALYFDQDGDQTGFDAIQIIQLEPNLNLTANDFIIA